MEESSPQTLCGAQILSGPEGQQVISTVCCVLRLDSKFYALTAIGGLHASVASPSGRILPNQMPMIKFGILGIRAHSILRPPNTQRWNRGHPRLGWVLLELTDVRLCLPNAYHNLEVSNDLIPCAGYPAMLPRQPTLVFIITSHGPHITGIFRVNARYEDADARSTETWVVTMHDRLLMTDDVNGALVVDYYSSQVYGQVIGITPLGDLLGVSMAENISQINEAYAPRVASLYNHQLINIS